MSSQIYKLVCERETGQKTISMLEFRNRERAQHLADSLNERFKQRRYFVIDERELQRRYFQRKQ
jgi:phosphoheptose isomerase